MQDLLRALGRFRHPVEAELAVSEWLGERESSTVHAAAGSPGIGDVLDHLAAHPHPSGLALLRVLATMGPEPERSVAIADELVAAGVPQAAWMDRIARPQLIRGWYYADVEAAQESVGMLYSDAGRDHALTALIDHDRDGTLKDLWFETGLRARQMHDDLRLRAVGQVRFRDVDERELAGVLAPALDQPPRPATPDQIRDVRRLLALTRSRTAQLAGGRRDPAPEETFDDRVMTLRVDLLGLHPPMWRRLVVGMWGSLADLDLIVSQAFGRDGFAGSEFEVLDVQSLRRNYGRGAGATVPIGVVLHGPGDRLGYVYGTFDQWQHLITVEAVGARNPTARYPRLIGGERAAPPEDLGGPDEYRDLLLALADPDSPDHDSAVEWVGEDYDPEHFEIPAARDRP